MSATTSATARVVAAGVLLQVHAAPDGQGRDAMSQQLARACLAQDARGRRLLLLLAHPAGRCLLRALQWCVLPDIAAHYAWRKRHIERWARAALDAGVRQVLILGAGYDALGSTLARHPSAPTVIEVDMPASVAIKRRALCECDATVGPLQIEADLARDDLAHVLAACERFDAQRATLVVAEGLLMYLERERVAQLIAQLRRTVHAPLHLIATAMSAPNGRPQFQRERFWVRLWLRAVGEPFRWGAARDALTETYATLGCTPLEFVPDDDPRDPDPAPGEWVFRTDIVRHQAARCDTRIAQAFVAAVVGAGVSEATSANADL